MVALERSIDLMVGQEVARMACVFAEDIVTRFENRKGSQGDVREITDRSCNEIEHRAQRANRWHPDSNWGMEALQASALPLGDATTYRRDSKH